MGCELGKLGLVQRGGESGKREGDLPEPPAPAPPDPRLPLTAKQKYSIMASWKGISRAMEPTGVYMFVKLFEEHQELLSLFEKFKELKTKEQQTSSMELAEHATQVMSTLDEGIKGLDNLDFFFEYLAQVGATHYRIPGFHKEYFWRIEKPFLEAVKVTLGDRYTDNVDAIYQTTIKFIIRTLIEGYEKEEKRVKEEGAAGGKDKEA
ncbi:neuroglobin-like [Hetaerina americana]|uniref:neuroglobin-like n=1 Tax=Hetaerina americana TaxID=62018 RepID=UPI003A7F478E